MRPCFASSSADVLSLPLHRTMLLGQDALPPDEDLRTITDDAVRLFLAAYGA